MQNIEAEKDLIEEVEALLAKLNEWPADPNSIYLALFANAVERERDSPFFGCARIIAQLYAASPELLRRLVGEVKALQACVADLNHDFDAMVKEAEQAEETMMRKMYGK